MSTQQVDHRPHALRVVIATALVITIVGMLSVALGALTRSTAGGAAILVFLMLVQHRRSSLDD